MSFPPGNRRRIPETLLVALSFAFAVIVADANSPSYNNPAKSVNMEGGNLVSSEIPVVEAVESTETVANPFKALNGDLPQAGKEGKKEAEEITLDGEFIKVEKEALEMKDASNLANPASLQDNGSTIERCLSNSGRELLESQEKTKELGLELERVIGALKHSESENSRLKDEVLLSKEKLSEVGKKYEELDLDHKKLQEQIVEADRRYRLQLANFEDVLQDQEAKQKELNEVKEAFDGVNFEIENSRKRMQELEQDLQSSVEEARKFEELHKQSGSHAESEAQRALEFERLLETAKLGAKEMEDQMVSLREEVKVLYEKVAENQKIDVALQNTTAELSAAQEELALSKSLVLDLEQRLSSKEALTNELIEELDLKKSSESKVKKDFSNLENIVAATKEDIQAKVSELEDIKLKLEEEVKARELVEATLYQSAEKNSELAEELKVALERSDHHENQANMNHQRSLELEDLFQISHSKLESAEKKVNDMELLLEAEKHRIQELEEQISKLEKKCGDSEAESTRYSNKVSELASELEAFQARASSLEIALQMANEKEKELTECLSLATDEKKMLEETSQISSEKLAEAENLMEILRSDLNLTQQKLESIENDLKTAGLRESEVIGKLKSAEEQLQQQVRELEQAKTRNSELESLHESLTRDSELKLQEVMEKFTKKDSEVKSLFEKLTSFEDQIKVYEEQVTQAAGQSASLKEELDQSLLKLGSIENTNEQLRKEIMEVENKALQSSSENELLVQTNIQIKSRVDELQELLNAAVSEKERTAQEIASHMSTIAELSDQHRKASELLAEAESKFMEAEEQLHETHQNTKKELQSVILQLEEQLKDEKENEESLKLEIRNIQAEIAESSLLQTRVKELEEQLVTVEIQLKEEVESVKKAASVREAELTSKLEDHAQKICDGDVIYEKVLRLQKDLQLAHTTIAQQKDMDSQKELEREAALKRSLEETEAKFKESLHLEKQVKELEDKLQAAEAMFVGFYEKGEKDADSHKELEREAALKRSLEEAEVKETLFLEKHVKGLEDKLQVAEAKLKDASSAAESKDGLKSRDIDGLTFSTPSKRTSKKKSEASSVQAAAPSSSTTQTETSHLTPLNLFLGGLVSVIIGIILGKRY